MIINFNLHNYINKVILIILILVTLVSCNEDSDIKLKQTEDYLNKIITLLNTNPDSALILARELENISEEQSKDKGLLVSYYYQGELLRRQSKYFEASDYLFKAELLAIQYNNSEYLGAVYTSFGNMFSNLGNINLQIDYYQKALQLFEEMGHIEHSAVMYANIASLLTQRGHNDMALTHIDKAIEIFSSLDNNMHLAGSYNIKADILSSIGDTVQMLEFANKCIEIAKVENDYFGLVQYYPKLAIIFREKGQLNDAINLFIESLELSHFINDSYSQSHILIELGYTYHKKGNYNKALSLIKEGLILAKSIDNKGAIARSHSLLASLYEEIADYQNALVSHKEYKDISDQMFNEDTRKQLLEMEIVYQTEKKEIKINQLNQERKRYLFIIYFITLLFFLTIVVGFYVYNLYNTKNKSLMLLAEKNIQLAMSGKPLVNRLSELNKKINLNEEEDDDIPLDEEKQTVKYAASSLSDEKKEQLRKEIIKLLVEEKLYKKPRINISKFSEELDTNILYISQIVNEEFGMNFNRLINDFRIKEALILLSDHENHKFTIETIAHEVGFTSIPTFNNTFKVYTGVTPSFFLKTVKQKKGKSITS